MGRYTIFGEIASGGMATIQYARLLGAAGFSRDVAIKRLHPQFAKDPSFVSMFLDEARLSARIAHANVVQTIDVLSDPGELAVVMQYVHGESLACLMERVGKRGERIPVRIAVSLMAGVLHGLHAAHETRGEHGEELHIVHRDVSPENILVGIDGMPRLIDFGIARAQGRSHVTPAGELKGKLAYMAPEQYRGEEADRRADVYGASVVLWEALAGHDLFRGESDAALVHSVLHHQVEPPSGYAPEVPPALDAIVLRGLSRDRDQRFQTAREMALALEREVGIATQSEVADWLDEVARDLLAQRAEQLRRMRMMSGSTPTESDGPVTRRLEPGPAAAPSPSAGAATPAPSVPPSQQRTRVQSGWRTRPEAESATTPRRRLSLLVGIAAVLSALAGGGWLLLRERDAAPGEEAARKLDPEPPAAAEPARPAAPSLPVAAPEPTARPASPAAETPDAGVSDAPVTAKPEGSTTKARSAKTRVHREPRGTRPASPAVPDCTQPFWIDAQGIRHVRRECL